MIYFKEESLSNYEEYQFRYTLWGIPESREDLEVLYGQGYLPYSDMKRTLPIFYLCRSLRVSLADFVLSSENRRVLRKISEAGIVPTKKILRGPEALSDEVLIHFFLEYFATHHGPSVMSRERLMGIFKYDQDLKVHVYFHKEGIMGAVIIMEFGEVHHYWFAAYSSEYSELSLGMWLMITFLKEKQGLGASGYAYLGTVYGQKALYKCNIEQVEYFDGNTWQKDLKILKNLMKGA